MCIHTHLNPEPQLCCQVLSVNLSSTLSHEHPRASTYQLIWWIGKFQLKFVKIRSIWGGFSETTYPFRLRSINKILHVVGVLFPDIVGLQEVNTQIAVSNLLGSTARPPCGLRTSITSSNRPKTTTNVAESWWTLKVPPTLQHIFYGTIAPIHGHRIFTTRFETQKGGMIGWYRD